MHHTRTKASMQALAFADTCRLMSSAHNHATPHLSQRLPHSSSYWTGGPPPWMEEGTPYVGVSSIGALGPSEMGTLQGCGTNTTKQLKRNALELVQSNKQEATGIRGSA